MEKFEEVFRAVAGRLNELEPDPKARCFFELMSGGLIWTDERPPFRVDTDQLGALRMLWNYRTSVLLGKPRAEFRALWDLAASVAPNWPAFLPERQKPNPDLMALVPESKKR